MMMLAKIYKCQSRNHDLIVKNKKRSRKELVMIHVDFSGKRKFNRGYSVCVACIDLAKKIHQLSIVE